ncbi:MAG TPA: DUF4142 domain-containing protein [Mucilaginibacter sp.]|jgi:putative membrane protein|nr:DUF4142 domain-containing protein [Mucilaginibacter sp.]
MNKLILWVPALMLLHLLSSCHRSGQTELNDHDIRFVKKAREADLAGIKAAQIAVNNSKNPRVVAFAMALMGDYNEALSKIKDIKTVSPADSISPAHQQYLAKIIKLTGKSFDDAYTNGELNDTEATLMIYVDAMQSRQDSLFQYAQATTLPIEERIDSAKKITASLR